MKKKSVASKKPPIGPTDYSWLSRACNIGIAIVLLTLLGYWIDLKAQTGNVFTVTGAVLGIVYSLYEAWRAIK